MKTKDKKKGKEKRGKRGKGEKGLCVVQDVNLIKPNMSIKNFQCFIH
jgi:hypothetical protein